MFVFFFMLYTFFFLVVGAVVFLVCATIPPLRKFALSAALWCVVWAPCVIAWLMFGAMMNFITRYGMDHMRAGLIPVADWQRGFGLGLLGLTLVSTSAVATAVAWLHQVVLRRMTFALFRVYAGVVSAGVGSVFGWLLGLWIAAEQFRLGGLFWLLGMLALIAAFGYEGYRGARKLRGAAPERFTWVTQEEFEGTI